MNSRTATGARLVVDLTPKGDGYVDDPVRRGRRGQLEARRPRGVLEPGGAADKGVRAFCRRRGGELARESRPELIAVGGREDLRPGDVEAINEHVVRPGEL